jgi:hypothetical protein
MPNTGSFSVAWVPRPFQPPSARRAFGSGDLLRLALVSGYDVGLVALDDPDSGTGSFLGEALAQAFRHGMHVVLVQVQLLGNLRVGQVQHPHRQGLVLPGQRRPGQVVEAPAARLALVVPQAALRPVVAAPNHLAAAQCGQADAVLPSQPPDGVVASLFTDQLFD